MLVEEVQEILESIIKFERCSFDSCCKHFTPAQIGEQKLAAMSFLKTHAQKEVTRSTAWRIYEFKPKLSDYDNGQRLSLNEKYLIKQQFEFPQTEHVRVDYLPPDKKICRFSAPEYENRFEAEELSVSNLLQLPNEEFFKELGARFAGKNTSSYIILNAERRLININAEQLRIEREQEEEQHRIDEKKAEQERAAQEAAQIAHSAEMKHYFSRSRWGHTTREKVSSAGFIINNFFLLLYLAVAISINAIMLKSPYYDADDSTEVLMIALMMLVPLFSILIDRLMIADIPWIIDINASKKQGKVYKSLVYALLGVLGVINAIMYIKHFEYNYRNGDSFSGFGEFAYYNMEYIIACFLPFVGMGLTALVDKLQRHDRNGALPMLAVVYGLSPVTLFGGQITAMMFYSPAVMIISIFLDTFFKYTGHGKIARKIVEAFRTLILVAITVLVIVIVSNIK